MIDTPVGARGAIAETNRIVVPEFPQKSSIVSPERLAGAIFPPVPETRSPSKNGTEEIATPSAFKQSIIRLVSSASRTFSSVVSPLESAARIRARFVMLFEPGIRTTAFRGLVVGRQIAAGKIELFIGITLYYTQERQDSHSRGCGESLDADAILISWAIESSGKWQN
jgi:hypothetical protein